MNRTAKLAALTAALLLPGLTLAQGEKKADDPWQMFRFFVGTWDGQVSGRFGEGVAERKYEFVLDGSFLQATHHAKYKPRERYPEGEVHRELSLFSLDRATGHYVLREFHNEAIVNEYLLDSVSADGKTIVMLTRHIENFRPGWRARATYKILGPDEFIEVFELAGPAKPFEMYVQNHFKRKP